MTIRKYTEATKRIGEQIDKARALANRPTLGDIFAKHGCDKGSAPSEPWMWGMSYERVYEPLLEPLRDKPITLLELGWGEYDPETQTHNSPYNGGRSARAWSDYFTHPDAQIISVDITPKVFADQESYPRVRLFDQTDQSDPEALAAIHDTYGDFDIIIDDASHVSSLTIRSFEILWPYLKPGGLYVVEDLHSSFHDWFFGKNEACEDPGNMDAPTAVNFFRRLATEPFYHGKRPHGPKVKGRKTTEWDVFPRKHWLGYQIESITFASPQIIVIRKRLERDYA